MPVIEFEKETIGNILISKTNLSVPINQRSYAWKKEHVEDLYRDLRASIDNGHEEYFLGAVIVVANKGKGPIEVFDGQQRLATSMILVAAIRDFFFNSNDEPTADTIARDFLRSPERKTNDLRPHFVLSGEDNLYFTDHVLRHPKDPERLSAKPDPKKDSHTKIDAAAKIAAEHVVNITTGNHAPEKVTILHRWLDFLEHGARVIWVEVEDQPTAYRIFETMNDRGLKLSAADLIKNYLYSLAGKRQAEVVQKWQSMSAVLESLGKEDGDLVDYIRYFWVTTHGKTRNNELFDALKGEVNSESKVASWVSALESRANDYAALLNSSSQAWNSYHQEIRATIATIRFLAASQLRPLLLAAYGTFTKREMEKLFKAALNWSVRCLLADVSSNTLEDNYSKVAKKISDGAVTTVKDVGRELASVIPSDERFKAAVSVAIVQTGSMARYYLRRIQMTVDGNVEPQYVPSDGQSVTLEHILPQKPGSSWKISQEEHKANYNRLGNQALLSGSANSRVDNTSIDTKRSVLAASPFTLTNSVAKCKDWGIAEIAARQKDIAQHAVDTWPLNVR